MDIKLDTLLYNGIIDPGKITEIICEGTCIWKGLSDNVDMFAKDYNFIGFDHSDRGCFNKPEYVINVSKKSLLMESKEADPEYGVPEEKKFPLNDRDRVKSAIKFFNYVKPEYEQELAEAIIAKMDKYGISKDNVGEKNRLSKYLTEGLRNFFKMSKPERERYEKGGDLHGSLFTNRNGIPFLTTPSGEHVVAQEKYKGAHLDDPKYTDTLDENTNILNDLRSDLQGELTAIKDYESHADEAEEKGFKDVADVLRDISKEEKVHCGELQAVLDKHDEENKEAFEDGEKEASESLGEDYDQDPQQDQEKDNWNPNNYPIMNDGDGKGDYYLDGEEKIYKPKPDENTDTVNESIVAAKLLKHLPYGILGLGVGTLLTGLTKKKLDD